MIFGLVLTAALAGCSSSSENAATETSAASPFANVDLANTRDASSSIEADTVAGLEPAWSRSLGTRVEGVHNIGSPVVSEGVAYLQDQESNVDAIDLESGKVLWKKRYGQPTSGPSGVIVAAGTVYGATPTTAFALDARTGEELWRTELVRNSSEAIVMTPGYHDGRVYFSTTPQGTEGSGVGVFWALDAKSGEKAWHFDTVPRGLWGHPRINSGGGLYYAPAFDGEGSVYLGISQAGPIPGTERYPWGSSRPGPNLYSDSIVKLDEKTGRLEWHYQITPHGLCNGYLVSPVLAETGGRKVVVEAGALGIAVALDRETGKPLWRRPVGLHNGHDNDGLLTIRGTSGDLKTPMTIYPGKYGGVAAPLSVRGSTVLLPIVNEGTRLLTQTRIEQVGPGTGELWALDLSDGAIRWKHHFPTPLYGPVVTTNDLVFAQYYDVLTAIEVRSGEEKWKQKLPAVAEGGMTVAGDTLLVRSGLAAQGPMPALSAYRLPH